MTLRDSSKDNICPICNSGQLIAQTGDYTFSKDGYQIVVPGMEFSFCQLCGSDPVMSEQAARNDTRVALAMLVQQFARGEKL